MYTMMNVFTLLSHTIGADLRILLSGNDSLLHIVHKVCAHIQQTDEPAIVLLLYNDQDFWYTVLDDTEQSVNSSKVSFLTGGPPPAHIAIEHLSLAATHAPTSTKECFVTILSPRMSFIFCGENQALESIQRASSFDIMWSFDPLVVNRAITILTTNDIFSSHARSILRQACDNQPLPSLEARWVWHLAEDVIQYEKHLYGLLLEERQALQEQLSQFDNLTAMLVHDLRTPLQSISLLLETLHSQEEANAVYDRTMVGMALQSVVRIDSIIQTLLDTNRLQAGAFSVQLQPINLRILITDTIALLGTLFEHAHLTLVLHLTDLPIPAWGDPVLFIRVLQNLLDNALHFTPSGGTITIQNELSSDGAYAQLYVRDTGRGIAPDALPYIFNRHFQGQGNERRGGGMGLYFCKLAMDAQHGTIQAVSSLGHGTTMTLSWPTRPLEDFRAPV